MTISGKIIQVLPAESVGQNAKSKQTFVLETEGQYPKKIAFDVWENKIALEMGENVTVSINIESREYNGKFFTNISGWKKEGASAPQSSAPSSAPAPTPTPTPTPARAPAAKGGKLTMAANVFEASVQKIAAEGDSGKQTEILNALREKYDMTSEQIDTLDNLILPF